MKIGSLNVIRIASEINQMSDEELKTVTEFLFPLTAERFSNYISFSLQEKDLFNIEVQEPSC